MIYATILENKSTYEHTQQDYYMAGDVVHYYTVTALVPTMK